MGKVLSMLVLLSIVSCVKSFPKDPYSEYGGDLDAAYAQFLMRNAVKFYSETTVEVITNPVGALFNRKPGFHSGKYFNTGSGVVVARDGIRRTSAVLTAWHVCDRKEIGVVSANFVMTSRIVKYSQVVLSIKNEKIPVKDILYTDKFHDLCVVEIGDYLPYEAALATKMPVKGAVVEVVGSPLGFWGEYLVSMQSGRYFGNINLSVALKPGEKAIPLKGFSYYGFAGISGYSGSGVYYKGRLVGLMTMAHDDYEHSSFGPPLSTLKIALEKSGYKD